jgi:hypothetical protein
LLSDKIPERCNAGVHAGVRCFGTANSPGYNAYQYPVNSQRSSRVTLANISAGRADHPVSDSAVTGVSYIALFTGYDDDFYSVKLRWK